MRPSTDSGVTIKEVKTWPQFLKIVAGPEYKNWAFRGQSDASWPLYSSLSRYLRDYKIHPSVWSQQEQRIGRIFRRKAHLFLEHVPDEADTFQWLALMQHHGAPTRLLDFTWSPFVAAFFALERATKDAAIWAIFVPEIWKATHSIGQELLTGDDLSLHITGTYEKYYMNNEVAFVTKGEPVVMNRRLIAQSGTFMVPGILNKSLDEILSTYPRPKQTITKFVLKTRQLRDEAMLALYTMNITNATLFPDLDGLARSMAYELEYHWAYNPKTLEMSPGY